MIENSGKQYMRFKYTLSGMFDAIRIMTIQQQMIEQDEKKNKLEFFIKKYGMLLTLEDVAEVFKFKTIGAVRKAHARGVLPVNLYRFPNKTGFYAKVEDISESIEKMEMSKPVQTSPKNR